jgi:ABC-2 type transport system permease protein
VLVVFGMGVNALGIIVAARMRSFEGFGSIVNFVIQPVFFLSSALYPVAGLPRLLRAVVLVNPMSYAVDAVRGLCIGHHSFPLALSVGVVVASAVVLGALATRAFRRMEA